MPDIPHFRWPLQFAGAGFAEVEQDSDEDIMGCCAAVLSYPLGSRESAPSFGLPDQGFLQGGADLGEIREAIEASEPRVEVLTEAQLEEVVSRVRVGIGLNEGGLP